MKITEHFTLEEAIHTGTGLKNILTTEAAYTIHCTAVKMELVREYLDNNSIHVNSWYRSEAVNAAVGGSKKSQHLTGEAVDFTCEDFGTPYEICQRLSAKKLDLQFDQLIYEGTWVHISFCIPTRVPRLEVLTCMIDKSYLSGLILNRGAK